MKKVLLITMMLASCILVKAQNYLQIYIDDIEPYQSLEFCLQDYDSIVVVDTTCAYSNSGHWFVLQLNEDVNGPTLTLIPDETNYVLFVDYYSCAKERFYFEVYFKASLL